MLTKDLITNIANATGMTKKRTEELLGATNAILRDELMIGKSITLQGLGMLEIKQRNERTIIHPRTGIKTTIPAKNTLNFRPAPQTKELFNNND